MTRPFLTALSLIFFSSSLAFAQGTTSKPAQGTAEKPAKKICHAYKLHIDTKVKIKINGQEVLLDSPTTAHYVNEGSPSKYSVQLSRLILTVTVDGNENSHMDMSKDRMKIRRSGKEQIIAFGEGNAQLKALLKANFHQAMATITTDKAGKELSRTVPKPNPSTRMLSGILHNIRWFHVGFAAEKTWTETREFDLGKGGTISGPIVFTKQDKKDAQGNTVVKLSGKMSKKSIKTPTGTLESVSYLFEGHQSYDEKRKIWVSGQTTVKATYKMMTPQGKADSSGTIILTLSMPKNEK
ncbi:MAG: hypothetical protein P1V97_33180 [Planctomycetota bacterium]|nr:hypothetical protein [Planctomycetota bacterium]